MSMENKELIMLGEISGKLDGVTEHLKRQDTRMETIDGRLRTVEQRAAVAGAISGGAMSVGLALVIEGLKQWVAIKGGGQ